MIRENGPQKWENIHVTYQTKLDNLIDIDNSTINDEKTNGFDLLKQAATDIDSIIQKSKKEGKRIRALGSGWALTDIAITDNILINTKLLNGCFEVSENNYNESYASEKRPYLIIAQCGIAVGELNIYLEVTALTGIKRALKTAGIGAGQTIAGAVSGNTHGAAINFGAMPDFVVGLQLITGTGKSLWIERATYPVVNDHFISELDSELIRDDDVFYAALVSFGAFGVITAMAIETEPVYHLKFPPVTNINHKDLKLKLSNFNPQEFNSLHHFEFIFDPYDEVAMLTTATKVKFIPNHPHPKPLWIIRNRKGFAPGDKITNVLLKFPLIPNKIKTKIQFGQYRKNAILGDVESTSGQLFTATITYLEGYTESAIAVSINNAAKMIDIIKKVIKKMKLPYICQARTVHPTKSLLGFTHHEPKTVIFEFGLSNDSKFALFEKNMVKEMEDNDIAFSFHWSKNSGIDPQRLLKMFGADRVEKWLKARKKVFNNDLSLMKIFDNKHVLRGGLTENIKP
jgi:hypothetical protein